MCKILKKVCKVVTHLFVSVTESNTVGFSLYDCRVLTTF